MDVEDREGLDIWLASRALRKRGIDLGEEALRKYAADGLAPRPVTCSVGGRGMKSMYPADIVPQAAASFTVLHQQRVPKAAVARARKIAVHCLERWISLRQGYQSEEAMRADNDLREIIGEDVVAAGLSSDWAGAYFDFSWTGDDSDAAYERILTAASGKGAAHGSVLAAEIENARYVLAWRRFFRVVMGLEAQAMALKAKADNAGLAGNAGEQD